MTKNSWQPDRTKTNLKKTRTPNAVGTEAGASDEWNCLLLYNNYQFNKSKQNWLKLIYIYKCLSYDCVLYCQLRMCLRGRFAKYICIIIWRVIAQWLLCNLSRFDIFAVLSYLSDRFTDLQNSIALLFNTTVTLLETSSDGEATRYFSDQVNEYQMQEG